MRAAKMKIDERKRIQIPSILAVANDWRPGDDIILNTTPDNTGFIIEHEKNDREGKFENKPLYGVETD